MTDQTRSTSEKASDHHGVGHIASTRIILCTGLALLFLTWFTVFTAGIDLGEMNIFVALGIASFKASLVCLYFMHLRWDRPFNALILVASLSFIAIFFSFALLDTAEYDVDKFKEDAPEVVRTIAEQGLK